ncbi:C40 family peptidase [Actinomadura sp. DC4]|uniref:C40 family peptidase n=1 Tax=Actinomadura sp. DC4 TaxID=3055069 RepID=UPI0025AFEB3A|nr:C40 family peptidase [Actinomadura sp. DC4]MDN3353201.1 NlpC/P60 family protein [Actinomadura sp. DC4]
MSKASRWFVGTAGAAVVAGLFMPATPAEAKPTPSLSAAKKQLATLNDQVDQLANQYNKAKEDWKAAQSRLKALNSSVTTERSTFEQLHIRVAQLAAAAYKSGGEAGSVPDLVSAKDPEAVLDQMTAFTKVSNNRAAELTQFLASAQRLERQKALAEQAAEQLKQQKEQVDKKRASANSAITKQLRLIDRLGSNIDPGSSKANCSILATGKAEAVLRYACAQLGKPYVFGGAGPSSFDCSGLTMMAYKQVGINMSHYVPNQYSASRHISRAQLQPGDLVFFHDLGHVGLYVGNGKFIQAPHTGDVVKVSSLSEAWYTSVFEGGGRLL